MTPHSRLDGHPAALGLATSGLLVVGSGVLVYALYRPTGALFLPAGLVLGLEPPPGLAVVTPWWPSFAHVLGLGLLGAGLASGRLWSWVLTWAAVDVAFELAQHPVLGDVWRAWLHAGWPALPARFALGGTCSLADLGGIALAVGVAWVVCRQLRESGRRPVSRPVPGQELDPGSVKRHSQMAARRSVEAP